MAKNIGVELGVHTQSATNQISTLVSKYGQLYDKVKQLGVAFDGLRTKSISTDMHILSDAIKKVGSDMKAATSAFSGKSFEDYQGKIDACKDALERYNDIMNSITPTSERYNAIQQELITTRNALTEAIEREKAKLEELANASKTESEEYSFTKSQIENLNSALQKNTEMEKEVAKAATDVRNTENKVSEAYAKTTGKMDEYNTKAEKIIQTQQKQEQGNQKIGSSLLDIVKGGNAAQGAMTAAFGEPVSMAISAVVQGLKNIIQTIKQVISKVVELGKEWLKLSQKQSQYIEDLNFLNNAYGDVNNSGKELLDTLKEVVGYDPAKLTSTLATYRQFGNALDYDAEIADTLAENMLKLSIDVKSITGQDLEKVSSKFQSALAGNIRAVRAYGVDITQAALGQEALALGIDKSIGDMTRAEKTLLTYIVMQKQLTTANGDLSRTVNSVANQTEIFHSQIDMLGRNIGAFLIPILRNVIPVLNGILMAINAVMEAIQSIFGITAEEYAGEQGVGTSDALEELYNSLESEAKAANKATKASKEAQKTLRGFDKLNVIKTPTQSSSGSGGGGVSGSGIDKKLIDAFKKLGPYELHLESISNWATKIKDKFLKLINWKEIEKWIKRIKGDLDDLVDAMKRSGLWDLLKWIMEGTLAAMIGKVSTAIQLVLAYIDGKIQILTFFVEVWGKLYDINKKVYDILFTLGQLLLITLFPGLDDGKSKASELKKALSPLKDVVEALAEAFLAVVDAIGKIKKGDWSGAFSGLKKAFDNSIGKMAKAIETLVNNLKYLQKKSVLKDVHANIVGVVADVAKNKSQQEVLDSLLSARKATGGIYNNGIWSPVKAYAGGGFPSRGEIFMARETKGPELVGRIGSSTAVLNNDQILEQMTIAVARGIAASGDKERPVQIIAEGDTEGLLNFINFKNASKNRQYGL